MVDPIIVAFLILSFFVQVILPLNAWVYVRFTYPRLRRRFREEPAFPVNLIVPCKGTNRHLPDNLRAISAQDYPALTVRFVTDTADDPAVPEIEAVIRETGRGTPLVAGFDGLTCGKNHAELVAIAADATSEVHLICDSDLRPAPDFVREMVRPYLDPSVNVTCSGRRIVPDRPSLGALAYAMAVGFATMLLAFRPVTYVWGGCFSVRRRAFIEWDVRRLWRGTEDDDLVLCNAMNERREKPVFVPTAVSPSHEAHATVRSLLRWLVRQGQTARIHYRPVWLLLFLVETSLCLGSLGAAAWGAFALATGGFSWQIAAAGTSVALIPVGGLLTKAPYLERRDMPLWLWSLLPVFSHIIVALAFGLAVKPTMRWGDKVLEFNKDGTIRAVGALRNKGGRRPFFGRRAS